MNNYNSKDIKVFKGLDAVRKRPGMYIGNTEDGSGLHKMIFEVLDNSVDEYLANECDFIKVCLHEDGYVTINDNGRGMPVDFHLEEGISATEVIMTILHSGAKFDSNSYKISGGLHGVGVSVVNALSSSLILKVFKDGMMYEQYYAFGKPLTDLVFRTKTNVRGTSVSFLPDVNIFKFTKFNYKVLFDRFTELAFLNPGIRIELIDERSKNLKQDLFFEEGGLKSFLFYLNKNEKIINKEIIYISETINDIKVNLVLQWIENSKENILCYTNNICQKDGGSHLVSLKSALTKVLKMYIEEVFLKKTDLDIIGEDIREGVVSVLSIYMHDPKFSSQIKDKLISTEVRQVIELVVFNKLKEFLYENPSISKLICLRIISSAKARYAAKQARDLSKKKSDMDFVGLSGKLVDCQENNPNFSELFLVEGDSAGGSAKQARDRRTQAILSLKGKILNVERSTLDKIFSSLELKYVVGALKCGINEFDIKKLRYHKIIFMTDADVDGSHIKTLLLTFFFRQMPLLIEHGHVFISTPPLYRFSNKNDFFYIKNKIDFEEFIGVKVFFKIKNIFNYVNESVLKNFIIKYIDLINIIDNLSRKYPRFFFENFIYFNEIIPVSSDKSFFDKIKLYENFLIGNKLNKTTFFIKYEDLDCNYIRLIFSTYGVLKEVKIDCSFFSSEEYKKIIAFNFDLTNMLKQNNFLSFENKSYNFFEFHIFMTDVIKSITSSYMIQRYKGLGEMNPDQLWETTMNPQTRILNKVKIKDAANADILFSNLMGENIESRKIFIDKNIHSFFNLDF